MTYSRVKNNNGQRKPKGAIKNGKSRDTSNIGCTRHRKKVNKTRKHNTT